MVYRPRFIIKINQMWVNIRYMDPMGVAVFLKMIHMNYLRNHLKINESCRQIYNRHTDPIGYMCFSL